MAQPTILDISDSPLIQEQSPPETVPAIPDPQPAIPSDPGAPPDGAPEFVWRGQRTPLPRDASEAFASALGTSPQTVAQWLQQGRDAAFHAEQNALERQQLEDERRFINAQRAQAGFDPSQGAPYGGYPNPQQMPQPGGFPPGQWPTNPQGYQPQGGQEPYVPPPPPAPQRGQMTEDAYQALLQYNQYAQQQAQYLAAIREEIRRDRVAAQEARAEIDAREQEAWLTQQAGNYLQTIRGQGLNIPDAYTADHLIADMNRYGLSGSMMPWADAFETAVGRRFLRHVHLAGAANVAAQMGDRGATFQVPPARASASLPAGDASQGNGQMARINAVRKLGEGISVREALGHNR